MSPKFCIVKAMVFPIAMYRSESWTTKAEHQRIDAFKLWYWRRLLKVPWTARRSNQSILKEINPEWLLEGLELKLQYFNHLMWKADSLEKTSMLGKTEGKRKRGWQRVRCLSSITDWMYLNLSKLWVILKHRGAWGAAVHGVAKSQTWLSASTTTACTFTYVVLTLLWNRRHSKDNFMIFRMWRETTTAKLCWANPEHVHTEPMQRNRCWLLYCNYFRMCCY